MKVAIIGAGNFVADRMIESFHLGDGPNVTAIARHPSDLTLAGRFTVDLRIADFLDVTSLARSFGGCSAAVHAAQLDASDLKRGVTQFCRAAAKAGIRRVVYLSSAEVHGEQPPPGSDEKSTLHTHHDSALTNALVVAERQFFAECRQLELVGYALRPGIVFGPRSPIVAQVAAELRDGHAWLLEDGGGVCNSLYIDNLVAAIRVCFRAKAGHGMAYLLSDSETVTWREFYYAAANELNISTTGVHSISAPAANAEGPDHMALDENSPALQSAASPLAAVAIEEVPQVTPRMLALQRRTWRFTSARAVREIGYTPAVSFAEGMRRSCAWWRFAQGELTAVA